MNANRLACNAVVMFWFSTLPILAQQVKVIREWQHDVSPPLQSMASEEPAVAVSNDPEQLGEESDGGTLIAGPADPVVQETADGSLGTIPVMNLLGLGSGFTGPQGIFQPSVAPPDANASVGATQVVETVNRELAVFEKSTGSPILGPIFVGILWQGFNAPCVRRYDLADPVVLYDKLANRWLVSIHTLGTPYFICLAVSTTGDATGPYNRYAFQVQADGLPTNEQLGIWPDGYYLAHLIFTNASTYVGPQACAVDRNRMIAGQTATMQCFQINNTNIRGMAPSDLDGRNAPPAGSPNYYLIQGPPGSNSLYLYRFHVNFTSPASSTFTGPSTIKVAPYNAPPRGGSGVVPQLGTTQLLGVNGGDVMPRLAYRNFPNANPPHESLVATHSVRVGTGSNFRVGLRWYELRAPGTTPTVFQQGTYSPDTTSRWMGSIAMDKMADIAIGYSTSSATMYPSIRYTGRVPSDPLNTLEAEGTIFNGNGSQTGGGRWGDYTSMSMDPSDDCTMWYTGEYLASTGALTWATRIFAFKFPSCH
jgi:hypothetical protein